MKSRGEKPREHGALCSGEKNGRSAAGEKIRAAGEIFGAPSTVSPLSGKKFGVPGASDAMKKVCAERPGKKRREALRKTTAAQRPLKIGREAGKTVLCPVYEAPRIKRPPSYGKNKARSGANCGRCWARSRENFGMWASCGMTGQAVVPCACREEADAQEKHFIYAGAKKGCAPT